MPPDKRQAGHHGGSSRLEVAADDNAILRHGVVRAVHVLAPRRGDDLDAADIFGQVVGDVRVAVELGEACFTPSAASALADLCVMGYDVDIRGNRFHARLAAEVQDLVRWRAQ